MHLGYKKTISHTDLQIYRCVSVKTLKLLAQVIRLLARQFCTDIPHTISIKLLQLILQTLFLDILIIQLFAIVLYTFLKINFFNLFYKRTKVIQV